MKSCERFYVYEVIVLCILCGTQLFYTKDLKRSRLYKKEAFYESLINLHWYDMEERIFKCIDKEKQIQQFYDARFLNP